MPTPTRMDRYRLGGTTYTVDPQAKLGAGSNGFVTAHPRDPNLCVKLPHPPDPSDRSAALVLAAQARKIAAICRLGLTMPPQFVLPTMPAYDPTGTDIIGFAMRRVPANHHKLKRLLDGTFRASQQIGLATVALLFADLFDDLATIHDHGLVIGDVNLGCVMFQPNGGRAWVDTDSWSYPGFPCQATTELFAHPDLYPNLEPGNTFVAPQPHHDRFALLVALMMTAIPGAHPFKMGIHPQVSGLQSRTTAGITLFDQGVKRPALIGSPDVLSDELMHAILERLKRQTDAPLDPALLRQLAAELVTCSQCGTEYHWSRSHCTKCQQVTMVQATGLISYFFEELFKASGTLLFAQVVGQVVYLVCRVGQTVHVIRLDERGTATVLTPALPNRPGARYRFFADCLVVCPNPAQPAPAQLELYRLTDTTLQPLDGTSTGVLEGDGAVFDTSSRFLYRTASNALVRCELFGPRGMLVDTHVAEVHQRQSWFTVDRATGADREVIFGYDRALRNWQWFVILGNTKGSRYQYHQIGDLGIRTGETIEDFAVHFSASSVLLVMETSLAGRDYIRYAIIGLDGVVHLNRLLDASDPTYPLWSVLRGKLHQGKSVLHVTPDGIVKQEFLDDRCTTLPDTTGRVSAGDFLLRLPGRVGIANRSGLLAMSRQK